MKHEPTRAADGHQQVTVPLSTGAALPPYPTARGLKLHHRHKAERHSYLGLWPTGPPSQGPQGQAEPSHQVSRKEGSRREAV